MKKTSKFIVFATAIGLFAGCGGGAGNVGSNASNTAAVAKIEKAVAEAPTRGLLVGLEMKAFEAWKNNNAPFWEDYFDEAFVTYVDGKRYDKAGEIKLITGGKCELTSFAFSEEKMTPIGNNAVVLTAKLETDGKCDGQKLPSPVISTSLYVRSANTWKSAYHNEVPLLDPAEAKPTTTKKPEANRASSNAKSDSFTEELFAIEKKLWNALKSRDANAADASLTEDLTLVDPSGIVIVGKKAVIESWMPPKCDIKTASPVDAIASQISPFIGILTYKLVATGTCEGRQFGNTWVTAIYQKDGNEWKAAYIFETPA